MRTSPATLRTYSPRSEPPSLKFSGPQAASSNTSWTRPSRSLSHTKTTPPRSRVRCTSRSRNVLPGVLAGHPAAVSGTPSALSYARSLFCQFFPNRFHDAGKADLRFGAEAHVAQLDRAPRQFVAAHDQKSGAPSLSAYLNCALRDLAAWSMSARIPASRSARVSFIASSRASPSDARNASTTGGCSGRRPSCPAPSKPAPRPCRSRIPAAPGRPAA